MTRVVVLLPPSEGKAPGGAGAPWDPASGVFGPRLAKPRKQVAKALAAAARSRSVDHGELFGVKDTAPARLAAKSVLTSPSEWALDRYTGVLFDALDVASLTIAERRRADAGTVMVSGLAGVVAGGDPLPDYKLPIGATLPGLGGLAAFWKPHVSAALDEHLDGAVVWDLLPGAHANAWKRGGTWAQRWVVSVVREWPDGRRTTVSHDNKSTKGSLARAVLTGQVTDADGLQEWARSQGLGVEVDGEAVVVVRRA